jgi:uncharacterized protein
LFVVITKTPDRYELRIDGQLAAFAEYVVDDTSVELPHTVTEPQFRGRGIAAALVSHILDELRAVDARVVPSCSYVAHFIQKHTEYHSLLTAG